MVSHGYILERRLCLENADATLTKAIITSQDSIHHLLVSRALVRAIVVFMAGEHPDAISRLDDLIATIRTCTTCYQVANIATDVFIRRTCIFLETRRWNVMTTRGDVGPPLFAISLISGWEFDLLDILIRQRLCEALYALGRTMELLWTKKSTRLYSSPSGFLVSSVLFHSFPAHSGFCLQTLPNNVSRASKTLVSQFRTHSSDPPMPHANFNLQTPIPLLREWAKATLFVVPRFTTYVALSTLSAFTQRRLSAHGDAASNTNRDANMSTIHTTLPPLLREWAKAKLTRGSWKDALLSAVGVSISFCCPYELGIEIVGLQFAVSRVEIYRVWMRLNASMR
ncbi:hypothetical protein EV363DRAFT_1400856 [Boletus edulis]|nr:hypothetical protein EV363DRAFT_1400856 [Boletus edulis]